MAATLATVMARSAQLTVGEMLRDQTYLQPDAIAIEDGTRYYSYRTFNYLSMISKSRNFIKVFFCITMKHWYAKCIKNIFSNTCHTTLCTYRFTGSTSVTN